MTEKRGRGRPRKPEGQAHIEMFAVRLSDDEKQAIGDAAARADKSMSTWARHALVAATGNMPNALLASGPQMALPAINAGSGKLPIANGYFWAAERLCDMLETGKAPADTVVYPAMFLMRHGLELAFKELIAGFAFELRKSETVRGHDLKTLWSQLENHLNWWVSERRCKPLEQPPPEFDEVMKNAAHIVSILHEIDPAGEDARYETTKSSSSGERLTRARLPQINLSTLADMTRKLAAWSQFVLYERDEEVEFLRSSRREREHLDVATVNPK